MKESKEFRVRDCVVRVFSEVVEARGGSWKVTRVSLQRIYKEASGVFGPTTVLKPGDIPNARLALRRAYEYLNSE